LQPLFAEVLEESEAQKVPVCFLEQDGLLIRKWRCPFVGADNPEGVLYQVVAPQKLRAHILELAHDVPMSGHTGVKKTKARVLEHFWWPGVIKASR